MNGGPRPDGARAREDRPESGLTLARAFQLMSQALSEFRSPVGQEALRLRMVAMHGREDALLDAGRFPRLLRQANDAEVADVRKVGDDDYEISRKVVRPAPLWHLPLPPRSCNPRRPPPRQLRMPAVRVSGRTASGSGYGSVGVRELRAGAAKSPSSALSGSSLRWSNHTPTRPMVANS